MLTVAVPDPNKLPVKLETPDFSPSKTGPLSMVNVAETLGNLWFSTTKTFNPFFNSKVCGFPKFILGAGPGLGCTDLSTCAVTDTLKNKSAMIYKNFVFISVLVLF